MSERFVAEEFDRDSSDPFRLRWWLKILTMTTWFWGEQLLPIKLLKSLAKKVLGNCDENDRGLAEPETIDHFGVVWF